MSFRIENGILKRYKEEEGITDVVIPDGVTSIGDDAFSGCQNLTIINKQKAARTYNTTKAFKGLEYDVLQEIELLLILKEFNEYLYLDDFKYKYTNIIDYMVAFDDAEAKAHIEENAEYICKLLIGTDDVERLKSVINNTNALSENNIDDIIDYAIEHTQNGGSPEPQVILMHYKNKHFGSDENSQNFEL